MNCAEAFRAAFAGEPSSVLKRLKQASDLHGSIDSYLRVQWNAHVKNGMIVFDDNTVVIIGTAPVALERVVNAAAPQDRARMLNEHSALFANMHRARTAHDDARKARPLDRAACRAALETLEKTNNDILAFERALIGGAS